MFVHNINQWLASFDYHLRLDSNGYDQDTYHKHESLIGCGVIDFFQIKSIHNTFHTDLKNFLERNKGRYIMGHISFEAKDIFEHSSTTLPTYIDTPLITFFVPKHVISVQDEKINILSSILSDDEVLNEIANSKAFPKHPYIEGHGGFAITKDTYIRDVKQLIQHIQRGDIYEINYCQPYHIQGIDLDPYLFYDKMRNVSKPPFGALYRIGQQFLCCASPERFVARRNTKLITQPIKGTNRRLADAGANKQQQHLLRDSQKERSENVMIVDLMRNDLAKICLPGSVLVDELFGVYAFRHVNQMISTISGKTEKPINIVTAMDALFPMGSMTGAPKVSALQLIDRYESFTRGLYSGTVGYIDPSGDWDFNVVIRSLVYDMTTQRASISAGGAITALSDPVGEYEESILKMESILTLLQEMS